MKAAAKKPDDEDMSELLKKYNLALENDPKSEETKDLEKKMLEKVEI